MQFVSALAGFSPAAHFDRTADATGVRALGDALAACLRLDISEDVNLARVSAEILRLLHLDGDGSVTAESGAALLEDPLCRALLSHARNVDAKLEVALTGYRRWLTLKYGNTWSPRQPGDQPFLRRLLTRLAPDHAARDANLIPDGNDMEAAAAIALQSFENDHVQAASPEEVDVLEGIKTILESTADTANDAWQIYQSACVFYGMYRPLLGIDAVTALATRKKPHWQEPALTIIERTVLQPDRARSLASGLDIDGDVDDPTSKAVQSQYDENPYPRWRIRPRPARGKVSDLLSRMGRRSVSQTSREHSPVRVLVAGSGTGRQAVLTALQFPEAEVTATDISANSLGYARMMAEHFGIANIEFRQNDLLHSDLLNKSFDVIECVGVLHHIERPRDGLQALVQVLNPDGLIRIGLYSRIGRSPINDARKRIEQLDVGTTPDEMRAYRERIMFGEEPESVWDVMRYPDFYNLNEFRDMLFNVHEHQFSLPEVQELIESTGLRFLRFELADEHVAAYREKFPDDRDMSNLENWNTLEHERGTLFRRMYVFWCQRTG